MEVKIKLTNHKTTPKKQFLKLISELFEVSVEVVLRRRLSLIDELIDVAKCSLKLAKILSKDEEHFQERLNINHNKNEKRGYHDEIK